MATATVTVRLDAEDKAAMERACKEMGLSMNTAVHDLCEEGGAGTADSLRFGG